MTPIRFLADENIDGPIVRQLQSDGHDVLWIAELAPGAQDDHVLLTANETGRVLVTSDHDFGELVIRLGRLTSGVVLVRLEGLSTLLKAALLSRAIATHATELAGAFTVVEPHRIRIRPIVGPTLP